MLGGDRKGTFEDLKAIGLAQAQDATLTKDEAGPVDSAGLLRVFVLTATGDHGMRQCPEGTPSSASR